MTTVVVVNTIDLHTGERPECSHVNISLSQVVGYNELCPGRTSLKFHQQNIMRTNMVITSPYHKGSFMLNDRQASDTDGAFYSVFISSIFVYAF